MSKDYEVKFVLFADDVRKEDNGKDIIIGAYSDAVVLQQIPALLPIFSIWFQLLLQKLKFDAVNACIKDPNSTVIANITGSVVFDNKLFPSAFSVKFNPLPIHMWGVYTAHLGMDCEMEKIGQFEVLSPEQFASRKVDKA